MRHKYVRFEMLGFVLWPVTDDVTHADIARKFERDLHRSGDKLISAGFADVYGSKTVCGGYSESLQLGFMKEDTEALKQQLGL